MDWLTYRGTCTFCERAVSKSGMARHLQSCPARKQAEASPGSRLRPSERLFHLFVEWAYTPRVYWLHLEVPGSATLAELDFFLRGVWLECCGHLSRFRIGQHAYVVSPTPVSFGEPDESDMNVRLDAVLKPGTRFEYEYDFGDTTPLELTLLGEREGAQDELVHVLARNEPPTIACGRCGAPATQICSEHREKAEAWLCDACFEAHGCGSEASMPVVNSPRTGVCVYTGES